MKKTTTATTLGIGVLLAATLVPGSALGQAPRPPAAMSPANDTPPFVSELLARGAAGEFFIRHPSTGVAVAATQPTDLALVKVTLAPGRSTGWHGHAGPSMVIVTSGTLVMRELTHRGRPARCTTELFGPGTAFDHPADVHDFLNIDSMTPVEFYVLYLVPEGASPAPIPAQTPAGC